MTASLIAIAAFCFGLVAGDSKAPPVLRGAMAVLAGVLVGILLFGGCPR